MGTIIRRRRSDGSIAYMAQIMMMRERKIVHRESKTFDRQQAALAWIARREAELARPDAALGVTKKRAPTLADAIGRYLTESRRAMGRTKAQVLETIKRHDLAGMQCEAIRSEDIVAFAQAIAARASAATVANYLSHLGAVFAVARPAWGYPLDERAMADAHKVARRLGVSGKAARRDRRPTLDDLDRILSHFASIRARRPASGPMVAIIVFAILSTRRQEEITRIAWRDYDAAARRVLVRDMKNPGDKAGNDVWCDLPAPAGRIIEAMNSPREGAIFPVSPDAISAAFTRACQALEIADLRFHDLRHEGVSRLFEMGLNIPHVAAVSGHRSWSSLQRYTHIRQTGDKFAGWPWIARAIEDAAQTQKGPPRRQGETGQRRKAVGARGV